MKQRIHLIGIGGSGLSSIARFLLESDCSVSGSDRVLSPLAQELSRAGARIFSGHAAGNITGAELVIRSSAVPDDNPEVVAAQNAGIPVLKRAEFLEQLLHGKEVIAIAGTHGKTTTTAMAAWVLTHLGKDPSFIIGGVAKNMGCNAHHGTGSVFVIEADEYDNMFLGLSPDWIVLTVIEHDHPDCFPTLADYRQAFGRFVQRLQPGGSLFASAEDPESLALAASNPPLTHTFTYGYASTTTYQAVHVTANRRGGCDFTVRYNPREQSSQVLAEVSLQVPGQHNVRNALAVIGLMHRMGLDAQLAADALALFTGAGRRFDLRGEAGGVTIIDDYAHHPTEIRATLAAARLRYPNRRIWALWQPHTFSRTLTLLEAFKMAFADADHVIVTEVYGARESSSRFSAADLVAQMPHPSAHFAATLPEAAAQLVAGLRPSDVLLVLSAGDADQVSQQVFDILSKRETNHA